MATTLLGGRSWSATRPPMCVRHLSAVCQWSRSRHFFTNLWVFALTDTEIATFLALSHQRWKYPERHQPGGVFLTEDERLQEMRLSRSTWRSTNRLARIGVVDRRPQAGSGFETGKVGDFTNRWRTGQVFPPWFHINDSVMEQPALQVIGRVLATPNQIDLARRSGS